MVIFSDVTSGGGKGPPGPSWSSAWHQYRAPSSSLCGVMVKVKTSVTGVATQFLVRSVLRAVVPL